MKESLTVVLQSMNIANIQLIVPIHLQREDLKEDKGTSGYKNVHWKVIDTQELTSNAKKVTVEVLAD